MKVDEQFKCKDCDNYNQCKYYHNRRKTSFICKEFQNQWGFIKELENIKADLKSEIDFDVEKMRFYINAEDMDRVFYNHIEELKGKQE